MGNVIFVGLALIGWVIGVAGVLALVRMAGDQFRAARDQENPLDPPSEVMAECEFWHRLDCGRYKSIERLWTRKHSSPKC